MSEQFQHQIAHEQMLHFETVQKSRLNRQHLHILVVEDQYFTRKLLLQVVGMHGKYVVHSASTVKDGLQLYLTHAPDIALLDIELPDGSGHELAHLIMEVDGAAYVVMVTGNNYFKDTEAAKTNKVSDFIAKPFSKDRIFQSIEKYFSVRKTGKG